MNECAAKHATHEIKKIDTVLGDFYVYDYDQYMDFPGYCPGKDEVSKSLDVNRTWDAGVYRLARKIFKEGLMGSAFYDVGCHVGWFSKLAQSMGMNVIGLDGDSENLRLFSMNVESANKLHVWFDEETPTINDIISALLMKIDIEGNEQYVLDKYEKSFKNGSIKNVIMEVSPIFNKTYPSVMRRMKKFGYGVYYLNGEPWNGKLDFDQTDLWFRMEK